MRRISIVLPNFNSVKYLSKVIDAFLAQDYPKKRLFVVDGSSTDGSHDVIKKYAEKHADVIWVRQKDTGISNAINVALEYVDESDIWGYLGADDLLLPGVLGKVNSIFSLEKSTNAVYFDSYSLGRDEAIVRLRCCPRVDFSIASLVRYGTIVGLQNVYIDAALVKKFCFNENAKYAMDYEFYLRLLAAGNNVFFLIPEPSSINIQDGNISQIHARRANEESLRFARQLAGYSPALFWRYFRCWISPLVRGGLGYFVTRASLNRFDSGASK